MVVGGDWNHALCGSVELYPSKQQIPEWVSVLNDEDLPEHFHTVRADNLSSVATCRGCDIPFEPGCRDEPDKRPRAICRDLCLGARWYHESKRLAGEAPARKDSS